MNDQAAGLRERFRAGARPQPVASTPAIVIGSGKGGVGKSLTAVTFAASLAAGGRRVLLVDGEQNLGNLHVLLGVHPPVTLTAVVRDGADPAEVVVPVQENLWLLPAESGAEALHGLGATDRARLQRQVSGLFADYDVVIIDAGAGYDSAVRCASLRAARLVLVTMPEATALTDAYALLKIVHGQLPSLPVDVMVNRTLDPSEGPAAFDRLAAAAARFLGRSVSYLGAVPEDVEMRALSRDPRRLLHPASAGIAMSEFHRIATTRLELPLPIRDVRTAPDA
ncbi:MAG: AAA family ATPase [Gemmatimonadales bacterium]